jgi:hypothetical protein
MWYVWSPGEVHTGFWLGDLSVEDHLEYLGIDGNNFKTNLQHVRRGAWTGLLWLRMGTGGLCW